MNPVVRFTRGTGPRPAPVERRISGRNLFLRSRKSAKAELDGLVRKSTNSPRPRSASSLRSKRMVWPLQVSRSPDRRCLVSTPAENLRDPPGERIGQIGEGTSLSLSCPPDGLEAGFGGRGRAGAAGGRARGPGAYRRRAGRILPARGLVRVDPLTPRVHTSRPVKPRPLHNRRQPSLPPSLRVGTRRCKRPGRCNRPPDKRTGRTGTTPSRE